MSDPQSKPQPTQGELIGSFIKLAQEFAGLAEDSRLMAEQHIRMAQEMEKASRITGTEGHKEQSPGLQKGMELLHILHPGKTENLQLGISKAIQSSYQPQDWVGGLPKETIQRTMVEPVLDGLGFTSDRREQTTINHEYCHWLRNADESIVALLVTDHRETRYGPEPADNDRLDARQKKLHRETRFEGRFVFTNGMEWHMYYPDGPVEGFIPIPFTLHQPDRFWDLFMLILAQYDLNRQNRS